MRRFVSLVSLWLGLALALAACGAPATSAPPTSAPPQTLRLATTTSTADSGLLDAILKDFETKHNASVEVIAVGTGQALALGVSGDVDVVLVHSRKSEDKFVADGDGLNRLDVMYNDFVIVGPRADPAAIAGLPTGKDAFVQIFFTVAPFASRGDDSGTHFKEKSIWASIGITPTVSEGWYFSLGQGMGETLLFANEKPAYTITDRGTWLAQKDKLPNLTVMLGGANVSENQDKTLLNPYGVIPVNPAKHAGVNFELATAFAEWITAVDTQQMIADYGKDKFGQPLFYPSSAAWKAAHP